jgi:hypothetical protein
VLITLPGVFPRTRGLMWGFGFQKGGLWWPRAWHAQNSKN